MESTESAAPDTERDRKASDSPSPSPAESDKTASLDAPNDMTQRFSAEKLAGADRGLASELAMRGVPPDEIQRLISLGNVAGPEKTTKNPTPAAPLPLELLKEEPFVPKPQITLPAFRDSTEQERAEADRMLTAANVARRRGNFKAAEDSVRSALELAPGDAAALELYGDILQSVGRVDDSAFAYQRAMEADPARKSAEKKYAELALLQNRSVLYLAEEHIPRSPLVAVLFSAVFPGAGQLYNGDMVKGIVTAAVTLALVLAIFFSPWGIPSQKTEQVPASLVVLILILCIVYIFAVIDANLSARRGKRMPSGWEV